MNIANKDHGSFFWLVFQLSCSSLDLGYDGGKDREQFTGFSNKWFQFAGRNNFCPDEQIQPVVRFVKFLQDRFELVDDVGIRFGSTSFTIVCTDRRAGAKDLLSNYLGFCFLWQTYIQTNNSQAKIAGSC